MRAHLRHPPPRTGLGDDGDEEVGFLPAIPVAMQLAKMGVKAVQQHQQRKRAQGAPPSGPAPYYGPAYGPSYGPAHHQPAPAGPRPYTFMRGEDDMPQPNGQPSGAGTMYLGDDDFEGGNPIGYDEQDVGWQEEDQFLRGIDDELDSIEGEDDDDEVGDDDEIGDDEIGRRMSRRTRRLERLEDVEGRVNKRLAKVPAGNRKRRKRILKRKERAQRTQSKVLERQRNKAERRGNRRGGKASRQAAALAAGGAVTTAAAATLARRRRGAGADMHDLSTFLNLPPAGQLVRLPFLYNASPNVDLSVVAAAGVRTVSKELQTAGVTYARLKMRGIIARFQVVAGADYEALCQTLLSGARSDGGIDIFYGSQLGTVEMQTDRHGEGVIIVAGIRDDSILEKNQIAKVTAGLTQCITTLQDVKAFCQAELICERIDDVAAERNP